jgi:hypothetical protein
MPRDRQSKDGARRCRLTVRHYSITPGLYSRMFIPDLYSRMFIPELYLKVCTLRVSPDPTCQTCGVCSSSVFGVAHSCYRSHASKI